MLQLYRSLAHPNVPRDYHSVSGLPLYTACHYLFCYCKCAECDLCVELQQMLKRLETLLMRFDAFDHPLLETMKQSAIEELSTVHAAIQCEIRVAEYDFTRSVVALHRLKRQLRSWSDHIDAVSDYPLFEDSGVNDAAGGDEGLLLLDEEDDNYDNASDSVLSSTSYSNQSTSSLARGHLPFQLTASMSGESYGGGGTTVPSGGAPSSLTGSLVSYRGARYANMGDTSYDIADETAMLERHPSGMSVNSSSSPVSETPSTIRRLLSQSSLLRRSGVLASALPIRRGLVQKPGDPYVSSGGATSSMPTNTLEQVILGGGGNGTAGTAGNGGNTLGASQTSTNGGGVGGNNNALAAEMMASSMKEQERDDGFALPVFQWSKRFYRSLVAKFTLYFHHWLNPFEKKTNYLGLKITRFIRTPLGISYLELMDVLLVKMGGGATQRGQGAKTQVMLILETQQLENKGAHYYESGYRCPSSSNARYSRTEQEDQDDQEEQEAKQKALASSSASGSSRTQSPVARAGGNSPLNEARRRSVEQQTNHALFMRVDREQNEEQNDFSELWGLRSWPAVFCYPDGSPPPLAHWPNLVSLIMDNRAALGTVRPV
ncbi:hypothetical protein BBJ28_00012806 [Nothophytophthora sp. Chile5]|nr:hypothetical protein BBJ28_00012806 [Nothophytophthora sp. Chile5]